MVDAALAGAGVERVAELAAAEIGRPVAIVAPARGIAAVAPRSAGRAALLELEAYEVARLDGRLAEVPASIDLVAPISSGGDAIGSVAMLAADGAAARDAAEFLHMAALATVTVLALDEAREQAAAQLGAGLIEQLRHGEVEASDVVRRAARLGCDLVRGAVVLVTEVGTSRPRQAMALIGGEYPGSICELVEGRIYSVLPARGGDEAPESTVAAATALGERLRSYGQTGISSFYADPADLRRAIQEGELVLDVVSSDERMADQLNGGAGSGVYRLLFRALASHPEEVRSFYEDTVAPLVRYDEQYRTELLATLESYLANDCNMNATARTIFAHRHTVAYRLQRVRELTQLDPMMSEDRERLSLGLKAYRIVAPTLPR
jgi:sugar diacid utilization regulator